MEFRGLIMVKKWTHVLLVQVDCTWRNEFIISVPASSGWHWYLLIVFNRQIHVCLFSLQYIPTSLLAQYQLLTVLFQLFLSSWFSSISFLSRRLTCLLCCAFCKLHSIVSLSKLFLRIELFFLTIGGNLDGAIRGWPKSPVSPNV